MEGRAPTQAAARQSAGSEAFFCVQVKGRTRPAAPAGVARRAEPCQFRTMIEVTPDISLEDGEIAWGSPIWVRGTVDAVGVNEVEEEAEEVEK